MKPTIGLVTKVHYALTDMFGIHVRGTYGLNQVEIEGVQNENYSAYAAGLGADFFIALGDKAMWYNTMGVGFGQSTASTETTGANPGKGPENTLTTVGAYFVTGFDVKVFGNMGVWMDWGCQVVGPTFGEVKMASDTAAIKSVLSTSIPSAQAECAFLLLTLYRPRYCRLGACKQIF